MTQSQHWEANTPKSWSAAQMSHLTRLSPEGFHFQLFTFFEFTKNDTIIGQEKITSDLKIFKITIMLSYQSGSPIQDLLNVEVQALTSLVDRDCCQRLQSRSLELITVLFCIFTGATALPVQTKWMLQGAKRFQRSKTSSRVRCWLVFFCCWSRPTPLSLPSLAFLCCASAKSKSPSWHELTLSLKQEYPARTHTHARTHSKALLDLSRETIYTLWSIKWYAKAQKIKENALKNTQKPHLTARSVRTPMPKIMTRLKPTFAVKTQHKAHTSTRSLFGLQSNVQVRQADWSTAKKKQHPEKMILKCSNQWENSVSKHTLIAFTAEARWGKNELHWKKK